MNEQHMMSDKAIKELQEFAFDHWENFLCFPLEFEDSDGMTYTYGEYEEHLEFFKCGGCGTKYLGNMMSEQRTDVEKFLGDNICKWCNEDKGYENE